MADSTGRPRIEAVKAGFHETLYGKYPKLQILMIAELRREAAEHPTCGFGIVQEGDTGDRRRARQIAV